MIGTLLSASGSARHLSDAFLPGDVLIHPPGADHHAVYDGPAAFAGLALEPEELVVFFTGEERISDPEWWTRRHHLRAPDIQQCQQLEMLLLNIEARLTAGEVQSPDAQNYWRGVLIEAFVGWLARAEIINADKIVPSAIRIVRDVEHYIEARRHRAVHISEICVAMNLSRRTLYRAFEEALGRGAISFLRMKRLSMAHSRLRNADPQVDSVTQIATELGFLELGRFSHQYKELFGEYPRETLFRKPGRKNDHLSEYSLRRRKNGSGLSRTSI